MPHTALSESLYYLASELYVYIELCKHILPGVIHGDIVQSVGVFFLITLFTVSCLNIHLSSCESNSVVIQGCAIVCVVKMFVAPLAV